MVGHSCNMAPDSEKIREGREGGGSLHKGEVTQGLFGKPNLFVCLVHDDDDDDEVMLNVLRCQMTYYGQVVTSAEARFNNSLLPRKPEGSLGRTAQDGHLDSHTAPEL